MDKRILNENEKKNYRRFAEAHAPSSNLAADCTLAFVSGGLVCVLGQIIGDFAKFIGVSDDNVKAVIPVSLIFIACLLTGFGVFDKLASKAKCGLLVPITGFANAVCSGAIDAKSEGFIFGVGAKMLTIAGPVIVYGTSASVIYGIYYYLSTIF